MQSFRKARVPQLAGFMRGALAGALSVACAAAPARRPPGEAPTPASVSVAEPGGDASDPHEAALLRQLTAPWGRRNDKDDQLHVPLPDWENWKRVRFWSVDHFAGFRYGKEHHAVSIVLVDDVKTGERPDVRHCLRRFERFARERLGPYDVRLGRSSERTTVWRASTIQVRWVDGSVAFGFSRLDFSAAWAAYPAYPDACLVYAMAVPWEAHGPLAQRVRDRWVQEGFEHVMPLTPSRPYRK